MLTLGATDIETPMTKNLRENAATHDAALAKHPWGRYGKPEDIARVAVFLASDDASFITGVPLPIGESRSGFYTSDYSLTVILRWRILGTVVLRRPGPWLGCANTSRMSPIVHMPEILVQPDYQVEDAGSIILPITTLRRVSNPQ